MRKIICSILVFCLIFSTTACGSKQDQTSAGQTQQTNAVNNAQASTGSNGQASTGSTQETTNNNEQTDAGNNDQTDAGNNDQTNTEQPEPEVPEETEHVLSNKKVIIIGNSHTYFGGMVKEIPQSTMKLSARVNDTGYFYQLCKANGVENMTVTNWTFGNHGLKDLFSGDCQANRSCGNGSDHLAELTDNNYDYVIFQQGSTGTATFMEWLDVMMNFFKDGNPNTKFVMLVQARAHHDHAADATKYTWLAKLSEIEQKGVTIVDWGAMVYDIYSGAKTLSGENLVPLNKNSFVIAKTESDGYHPSLLAGYITTLMTYCAITGESAVGQDYAFCYTTRDLTSFINSYYIVDDTNLAKVFGSKETMLALQQTVDEYLAAKGYRNYK